VGNLEKPARMDDLNQAALVNASALRVGYRDRSVLTVPELRVMPGQLVALLGPNGAGKSTLLRTLAGVSKAMAGEITWGARSYADWTSRLRARAISFGQASPVPIGDLRVRELAALGRTPYTDAWGTLTAHDHEVIADALAELSLTELASRRLESLSDGQRQRAYLAKILAQQTPLVLLDEPTLHLDLPTRSELLLLLRRLASGRRAVVLATHDLELASALADVLWVIDEGQLSVGSLAELHETGVLARAFSTPNFKFDSGALLRVQPSIQSGFTKGPEETIHG
jgi:iron complex transport system ATP-binding protein